MTSDFKLADAAPAGFPALPSPGTGSTRRFRYLEASDFNAAAKFVFACTKGPVSAGDSIAPCFLRFDIDPVSPGTIHYIEPLSPLRRDLGALLRGGSLKQRLPVAFDRLLSPTEGRLYPMVGYLCDALVTHGLSEVHLWLACVDSVRLCRFGVERTPDGKVLVESEAVLVRAAGSRTAAG